MYCIFRRVTKKIHGGLVARAQLYDGSLSGCYVQKLMTSLHRLSSCHAYRSLGFKGVQVYILPNHLHSRNVKQNGSQESSLPILIMLTSHVQLQDVECELECTVETG
jgi:hypothetical protein